MSLDFELIEMRLTTIYDANITHNLTEMASQVGLYKCLWHPEELGITKAFELVSLLEVGLEKLRGAPEYYKKFNPSNNWGTYDDFVVFVEVTLQACKDNPDANVQIDR